MKKRILIISVATLLGISSLAFNSFATNNTNQMTQESQRKERPERKKNEVFGKITAISENSVTISLAEMKKPENGQNNSNNRPEWSKGNNANDGAERKRDGNRGNNENGNGQDRTNPPERKQLTDEQIAEMKKNLENMFTITGETKTIDISTADFNDFGRRPKNNNDANTANNTETKKTYKDYQVGDYITIELESETSNKAKAVRDAFGARGGMQRGNWGKGVKKDRSNNGTNNSNQ